MAVRSGGTDDEPGIALLLLDGDDGSTLHEIEVPAAAGPVSGLSVDDDGRIGTLVFDFGGQTVSQVGAVLNFDPDFTYGFGLPLPLYIAAYGLDGTLLDSYELPVFTPGAVDEGAFYGIRLATASIARFEVSGPYAVVDDLSFSQPVTEPGTWALMAAGLAALAVAQRRQRR